MLDLICQHSNGTIMQGGLKLVDLAGSERLDRTGTLNDAVRLKETVNINKSLSSLSDVFTALSNKAPHIPYRNSKLTLLLQDCLSGDGKALMFVNVSPTLASSQETLCSLRFANQVSQVELGKAQKSIQICPQVAPPVQTTGVQSSISESDVKQVPSSFNRRGSMVPGGMPIRAHASSSHSLSMFASVKKEEPFSGPIASSEPTVVARVRPAEAKRNFSTVNTSGAHVTLTGKDAITHWQMNQSQVNQQKKQKPAPGTWR